MLNIQNKKGNKNLLLPFPSFLGCIERNTENLE